MRLFIIHIVESYLPLLNLTNDPNPNKATSSVSNISILGDRFREQLEGEGIGATNDKSDVGQKLISKGLNSNSSYKMSREIVQQAMVGNKDLQYFLICIVIVPERM